MKQLEGWRKVETKVEDLLKAAVQGLKVPVIDKAFPDVFPCITFHFYNESGALFGAGTATEEDAMCQVDIWYKVKTEFVKTAIAAIKQAIINERYFSFPKMETVQETATKIHHTYINFELIKESEE
jgi:hypothetical protein